MTRPLTRPLTRRELLERAANKGGGQLFAAHFEEEGSGVLCHR